MANESNNEHETNGGNIKEVESKINKEEKEDLKLEQEFILVKDVLSGETMELPTQLDDNTLGLTTLVHAFPGAHGLKYKTENGVTRALLIDPSGTKFFAPNTGWQGKVFTVIYNTNVSSLRSEPSWRTTSDQNAKRKKMMDEDNSSDSDHSLSRGHHQVNAKQKRTDEPSKSEKIPETEDETENYKPTDLIVLGLPFKLTSDELRKYFTTFGKLAMCEVKKDAKGGSRGFGFIQFEEFESQLKVLTRPIHTIGGRRCEVKLPLSKVDSEIDNTIQKAKLFIGRLQEKTGEVTLKEFFLTEARKIDPKADILDVYIPKPFRSFAFITFNNMRVVRELIKKGDYIIDGLSVSVSSAAPKTESNETRTESRRIMIPPSTPEYGRMHDSRRANYLPTPSDRFNEVAFLRPEQRKRAFMETRYVNPALPFEHQYQQMPISGVPSQHTLASGFETLNLNQIPHHEMMKTYYGMPQNPIMRPPQQYTGNSRFDYGPSGSNRVPDRSMPSYRDDFGYF